MEKNEKLQALVSQKGAQEVLENLGQELHFALFPEEYDHMYDSVAEAKDRQCGKNPMNAEYIELRNTLRAQLGFTHFTVGPGSFNDDTYSWIMEKLRHGEEVQLREIIANRADEALEDDKKREQARQRLPIATCLDQHIDNMLLSEKFLSFRNPNKTNPNVIAFRILGELFSINPQEKDTAEFFRQIRRLLPDLPEFEYQTLYRQALDGWVDAYGYC